MANNPINSFLFDMDGVLLDSMKFHEISWKKAFRTVGLAYPTDRIYLNEGRPGSETIIDVYKFLLGSTPSKTTIEQIYTEKTRIMAQLGKAETIPGMVEVVEYLKQKQYKLCVVTGSSQKTLLQHITKCFNSNFENNVITGSDVSKGKPNAEPYLKALELLGSKAKEAIVIENAPLGIMSAKNAGIFTIALNTGPLNNSILLDTGADLLLNSAYDLLKWLKYRY